LFSNTLENLEVAEPLVRQAQLVLFFFSWTYLLFSMGYSMNINHAAQNYKTVTMK